MEAINRSLEKHSTEINHLSIEIITEDILSSSIKEKMESISLSHSISRISEKLFKGEEENYFPSLVSIGPFHHGRDNLKPMEAQKLLYLNTLLSRKPNVDATLDTCIKSLRHAEQKARKFYDEKIEIGSDEFVEMILIDSCFLIELFIEYSIKNLRRRDDPYFSSNEKLFQLRCDLILLENQIPFFILDQVFNSVPIPKQCDHLSLIELTLCFFKNLIPPQNRAKFQTFGHQTHHFLDLIRNHYLPTVPAVPSSDGQMLMHNATHLYDLGVKIEKSNSESPSNVIFFNGSLKIPSLEIHAYTEILFKNIIAMEHGRHDCTSKQVTSYVVLMERLIRSKRDARLLLDKDILIDEHEREGEIVFLFKKLHMDLNVNEFYYRGLCEEINGYQPRKRGLWQKIRHVYHRTELGIVVFTLIVVFLVVLFTGALFTAVNFVLHHFQ